MGVATFQSTATPFSVVRLVATVEGQRTMKMARGGGQMARGPGQEQSHQLLTASPLPPEEPWGPGKPLSPFSPCSPGGPIRPIKPG